MDVTFAYEPRIYRAFYRVFFGEREYFAVYYVLYLRRTIRVILSWPGEADGDQAGIRLYGLIDLAGVVLSDDGHAVYVQGRDRREIYLRVNFQDFACVWTLANFASRPDPDSYFADRVEAFVDLSQFVVLGLYQVGESEVVVDRIRGFGNRAVFLVIFVGHRVPRKFPCVNYMVESVLRSRAVAFFYQGLLRCRRVPAIYRLVTFSINRALCPGVYE